MFILPGKVYRARDTKTGELVAIKVIFWERIRSASGKVRLAPGIQQVDKQLNE